MKYKKDLVSIILNCFNGSEYLKEALISIQNQTYKNWELIFFGIIVLKIVVKKSFKII